MLLFLLICLISDVNTALEQLDGLETETKLIICPHLDQMQQVFSLAQGKF